MIRRPEQLRPHRALDELGLSSPVSDFNAAARMKNQSIPEPILITGDGTILAGMGRWRLEVFEGTHEIHCIEYFVGEEESLVFILTHHQPGRGWSAFVRIRVALTLEPYFQQRGIENMRAGGKGKGSANLPNLQHVNSLSEVANLAGVGTRNVSNVKTILRDGHPRLIEALQNGTLTINRAIQFCKLRRTEQLTQFAAWSEECEINRVIRQAIGRAGKEERTSPDPTKAIYALQQQEARQPGSVAIRVGRQKRTVILVGQDLLTGQLSQKEFSLS